MYLLAIPIETHAPRAIRYDREFDLIFFFKNHWRESVCEREPEKMLSSTSLLPTCSNTWFCIRPKARASKLPLGLPGQKHKDMSHHSLSPRVCINRSQKPELGLEPILSGVEYGHLTCYARCSPHSQCDFYQNSSCTVYLHFKSPLSWALCNGSIVKSSP